MVEIIKIDCMVIIIFFVLLSLCFRIGDVFECLPVPVMSSKPTEGVFDWLKTAVYEGQSTEMVTGLTLDVWKSTSSVVSITTRIAMNVNRISLQLGEGIFRLGVSTVDSNRPIAMYINAGKPMSERLFHIQQINTYPPHDFAIPAGCPQSMTVHEAHPLLMPAMMGLTKAAKVYE